MPLLIPQFELSQDDKYIKIEMHLPYVKVTKAEFHIEEKQFSFYLKPYLLQLGLNECLKNCDCPAKLAYDPEKQNLDVHLLKQNENEEFTDLNMISLILKKKQNKNKQKQKGHLIEVIDSKGTMDDLAPLEINQINQYLYGFNNGYKDVFDDLEEELLELSILDPKLVYFDERMKIAQEQIKQSFDKDIYLYDLLENEQVDAILEYQFVIQQNDFQFTIQEINQLSKLPKKEYLINERKQINNGLIDIIFAYLYELIVTQGELNNESARTINQLSSCFSCFANFNEIKQTLINSFQRCLTFPLIRSFELCIKTKQELCRILDNKVCLIKWLLDLQSLFNKSKPRQYLNLIYVDDYLIYVQMMKEEELKELKKIIENIEIQKQELELNIVQIEQLGIQEAYQIEQNEQNEQNN